VQHLRYNPGSGRRCCRMKRYTHLSLEEREKLFALYEKELSLRDIAKRLRRNVSSISRELKRNKTGEGKRSHEYFIAKYVPCRAQKKAEKRAEKQRQKAPLKNPEIFLYVRTHLRAPHYWTPEEIAGRLPLDHPGLTIDDETIYRYIYGERQRRMKLWKHLRHHRKRRMKHQGRKVKGCGRLATALKIEERPEGATTRSEPGHWETDNIGTIKTDKTGISASVERKSRKLRLGKLKDLKAKTKRITLVAQITQEHPLFQKTMTIDRGPENSEHEEFTAETTMPVYACNPYHSWEKGSVENTIGRARRFIPKGKSVDHLTQRQLTLIETIMNNTPRKCLGYLTPNEVYEKIIIDSHSS
jgi:transposase, IS30 family